MKKYLVTWYGTTDLKAALGLEPSSGPVLDALSRSDFTDAIILGYTNPDKCCYEKSGDTASTVTDLTGADFQRLQNSETAHKKFLAWLNNKLIQAGKSVRISFMPVKMKHLHDTEEIYDAARKALARAENNGENNEITLFVSPGTPVMAFVWAFAALAQPLQNIRLLASSVPGKSPEIVSLPQEWLDWHGKKSACQSNPPEEYDIVFHLTGGEKIPILKGVLQFPAKKHVFIHTDRYLPGKMKNHTGDSLYDEIKTDAFDPVDVRSKILDYLKSEAPEAKIAFNLTGGTKPMYAGAYAACRKINGTPFYINNRNQLLYLDDFSTVKTNTSLSVDTFINLNLTDNLFISDNGKWENDKGRISEQRMELTLELWRMRSEIASLYSKLADRNIYKLPEWEESNKTIALSFDKDETAKIILKGQSYIFKKWRNFPKYIMGGWFEEYVYLKLKPLLEEGIIYDLRIGLQISHKDTSYNQNSDSSDYRFRNMLQSQLGKPYQELDIVFSDGQKLYIIECKAGRIISDFISKISENTKIYGGGEEHGILACCFPPSDSIIKKKIEDGEKLTFVTGNNLVEKIKELISGKK